jgi:hypothetical protein
VTGFNIIPQTGFSFNDNEAADSPPGKVARTCHYNPNGVLQCIVIGFGERCFADLGESPPYIPLKNDYYDEKNGTKQGPEQPVKGKQFKLPGAEINDEENSDTDQHLYGPCSPYEKYGAVDDERYQQNINYILPAYKLYYISHKSFTELLKHCPQVLDKEFHKADLILQR